MEDFEFDKHLKKAITAAERKKQKVFLQSVEANVNKVIAKPTKINWFIAASIVAVISFSGYFVFGNQAVSNQELYAENFTPYRNIVVPIVRNDFEKTTKIIAFAKYETKEYTEAISLFNQLETDKSVDKNTIHFYKANAYLQLNKPKEAIKSLLKISDNSKWQEEVLWYLALASLKTENQNDAKKYLLSLKSNNKKGFKSKEINKLLKQLE
ncbi:MAG: hypothetical protein WAO74_12560 [Polaribacter sp.]|uniref:tetratricopeptide repeat protein n=1 Tax=Polaribacter sp. TaxID=1920175 RepID=UPI003BAF3C82